MSARSVASPGRRNDKTHGSPSIDRDQVCEAHLAIQHQPGDDGRRLPWNRQDNTSASICTDGAA